MSIDSRNYSVDHIIDDRAFEPQRTNHAYVQFEFPSDFVDIHGRKLAALDKEETAGINPSDPNLILRLALTSNGMPNQGSEVIAIRKGNEVVKFAGGVSYEDIDMQVTDFIGLDVENLISAWDGLRYNPVTGQINRAYRYKRNGSIVQYSPDGELIRSWTLKGAWINNVKYGDYNRGETGSEREISFTLHVDKAYPDLRTK